MPLEHLLLDVKHQGTPNTAPLSSGVRGNPVEIVCALRQWGRAPTGVATHISGFAFGHDNSIILLIGIAEVDIHELESTVDLGPIEVADFCDDIGDSCPVAGDQIANRVYMRVRRRHMKWREPLRLVQGPIE